MAERNDRLARGFDQLFHAMARAFPVLLVIRSRVPPERASTSASGNSGLNEESVISVKPSLRDEARKMLLGPA